MKRQKKAKLSSVQIIALGFFIMIGLGTALLMLPLSSYSPGGASFLDALFTATSASCVTGLVPQDTGTYWTTFGQVVIILLIQVGGLGFMSIATLFLLLLRQRLGLRQREVVVDSVSYDRLGGFVPFIRLVFLGTLLAEGLGAILLSIRFVPQLGWSRGIYYGVWHSISAFCNAGFDLMGQSAPFSSLTDFAADPVVNVTIMALIVIGGIGFMTWDDVKTNRLHLRRYRMQSKVVLSATAALIILPAIYFFFLEFDGAPMRERVWLALFQSVTPRTAGFNTADLTALSEDGLALTILLMLVGGSPGSTAGGMKTTTMALLLANAAAVFRRREHAHFFGRRVDGEAVRSAATVAVLYLLLFLGGGLVMSRVEGLPLLTCLFETASAVGTVGLTLGITPSLGGVSRAILIGLMYVGRVGGLTLVFSALAGRQGDTARLPREKLTVG